jgi:hypothetical protein
MTLPLSLSYEAMTGSEEAPTTPEGTKMHCSCPQRKSPSSSCTPMNAGGRKKRISFIYAYPSIAENSGDAVLSPCWKENDAHFCFLLVSCSSRDELREKKKASALSKRSAMCRDTAPHFVYFNIHAVRLKNPPQLLERATETGEKKRARQVVALTRKKKELIFTDFFC